MLQGTPVAFTCSPSYTGSSKARSAADKHWGQRDREPLAWAIAELSGDKGLSWSCSLLLSHVHCPFCQDTISVSEGLLCCMGSVLVAAALTALHVLEQTQLVSRHRCSGTSKRHRSPGLLGRSELQPSNPAQKPEQTNQQQLESQNRWRTRLVPSPTALGPVFPELQVAQLSGEALCLVSGAAPAHATVGLMYFWASLHSCCSSCIFRNADGSLQILIIFWLHLLFECNKQTQILQWRPRGHPELLCMLGDPTVSVSLH